MLRGPSAEPSALGTRREVRSSGVLPGTLLRRSRARRRHVATHHRDRRNSQILWIEGRQATSDTGVSGDGSGVMSTGRSRSLPWWNTAPARTNATRCGALTARHRDCAASISL